MHAFFMAKNKNKEILTLAVLVTISVALNLTLILLVEIKSSGSINEKLLNSLTGYNQLDIFSKEVLEQTITKEPVDEETTAEITPIDEEEAVPEESVSEETQAIAVTKTWDKKTIYYKGETSITIDYERGIMEVEGQEIPIIVDGGTWEDVKNSLLGVESWVPLTYDRFDVFIDSDYYAGRETALQDYFDKLHPRFIEMETQTGWSSERFYSTKLNIYIQPMFRKTTTYCG